jgi:NAD(P)-dependent dehydrogenase (short-subunit alcohol dehydrogenase family)
MPPFLQSKTVLVTGATNGIGFVIACELACMGVQGQSLGATRKKPWR